MSECHNDWRKRALSAEAKISELIELGEGWASVFGPNGLTTMREAIDLNATRRCGYELLQTIDPERRFDADYIRKRNKDY